MAIQVGEKIVFTFVVIILIASVSVEFVSFKAVATAFPLSAFMVIAVFSLFHGISLFIIILYQIYINENKDILKCVLTFSHKKCIPLALCQCLSQSVIFISVSKYNVNGCVMLILMQLSIPLSIIFAFIVNETNITRKHWFSLILIIIGSAFAVVSNILYYKSNEWYYTIIVFTCSIPAGLGVLYQENAPEFHDPNLSIELVQTYTSLYQFIFSLFLSPFLMYIQTPKDGINNWSLYVVNGLKCMFKPKSVDNIEMYCPYKNKTIILFTIWLCSSLFVIFFGKIVKTKISSFFNRLALIIGTITAFVIFQLNIKYIDMFKYEYFDETLFLGILCCIVGSSMLLIDFNYEHLSLIIDTHNNKKQTKMDNNIYDELNEISIPEYKHQSSIEEKSQQSESNYVEYLLSQHQKEVRKEEILNHLEQERVNKELRQKMKSHSFHSQFYHSNKLKQQHLMMYHSQRNLNRMNSDIRNNNNNNNNTDNIKMMSDSGLKRYNNNIRRHSFSQNYNQFYNINNINNINNMEFDVQHFTVNNPLKTPEFNDFTDYNENNINNNYINNINLINNNKKFGQKRRNSEPMMNIQQHW